MAVAVVQLDTNAGNFYNAASTSIQSSGFASSTTTGNRLVAMGGWFHSTGLDTNDITSVTDDAGCTWYPACHGNFASDSRQCTTIWYSSKIGTGRAAHKVTLTRTGANNVWLCVLEMSGTDDTMPLASSNCWVDDRVGTLAFQSYIAFGAKYGSCLYIGNESNYNGTTQLSTWSGDSAIAIDDTNGSLARYKISTSDENFTGTFGATSGGSIVVIVAFQPTVTPITPPAPIKIPGIYR